MATLTILPSGIQLQIAPGQNLLRASRQLLSHNAAFPQTCGGKAECASCVCVVLSGDENLLPPTRLEKGFLARQRPGLGKVVRLACQTVVSADGEIIIQKKLLNF